MRRRSCKEVGRGATWPVTYMHQRRRQVARDVKLPHAQRSANGPVAKHVLQLRRVAWGHEPRGLRWQQRHLGMRGLP